METRALSAALAAPAFTTRGAGAAMHAAERHIERWAPEARAAEVRPLRSLGFVDRLITPWLGAAQRSVGMRMLGQTLAEREPPHVSWVFPRPWYLDELAWMAAARQQQVGQQAQLPAMLTVGGSAPPTPPRGTYVAPSQVAMPAALYEYVAPSLALAPAGPAGLAAAPRADAYSPLVPLAALHAAQVMARVVAPMGGAPTPQLRGVMATMLARSTVMAPEPSRKALAAPEMVTPPAPTDLADQISEQRARVVELGRIAEAQVAVVAPPPAPPASTSVEERVALRIAERGRLHEQARREAASHARTAPTTPAIESAPAPVATTAPTPELARALAETAGTLPPALASAVVREPARAVRAIAELEHSLRTVELLARSAAAGTGFEAARGPRLLLPAGLGGLVAMQSPAIPQAHAPAPQLPRAVAAVAARAPAGLAHVAWADRWLARFAGASQGALDVLSATTSPHPELRASALAAAAPGSVFVAPVLDTIRDAAPPRLDDAGTPLLARQRGVTPAALPSYLIAQRAAAMSPVARAPEQAPLRRFDDAAETPDDVFAAIAAGAATTRARAAAPAPVAAPPAPVAAHTGIGSAADVLAHAVPSAPAAGLAAQLASSPFAAALRHVLALPVAPRFDVRALLGSELATTYLAGLLAPSAQPVELSSRTVPSWEPAYVAPRGEAALASEPSPLTALQTALLSWETDVPVARAAQTAPLPTTAPLLGELAPAPEVAAAWTAPGMVATRAHGWSVAQERSTADLAYDFVTPELVLAARVYGLGPAEAAQAARLAAAGPGQLTAMASAIDRAFVHALSVAGARRDVQPQAAVATAYPSGGPSEVTAIARAASAQSAALAPSAPSGTAFGVARRVPRGAYLWPPGAVSALGLAAPAPDSELSMSVAALELLAAHAVVEIGASPATAQPLAIPSQPAGDEAGESAAALDVGALVPVSRRARFDALYIALGNSPAAASWSPAARAARALALVNRTGGDESAPASAHERALAAWDVLPVVHAGGAPRTMAASSSDTGMLEIDARPGLAMLSARAGEALGSYVAPPSPVPVIAGAPASAPAAPASSTGAMLRVPTAAQELVQPGRPAGRHGGGETEIPPWFEAAARRMLEERHGSASDGISLAELTLVTAAPASHVAAASRSAPAAAPAAPAALAAAAAGGKGEAVDVEKLAHEIYRYIMVMMDVARARNGEPYL